MITGRENWQYSDKHVPCATLPTTNSASMKLRLNHKSAIEIGALIFGHIAHRRIYIALKGRERKILIWRE
jgi:hypothetical protein